MSPGHKKDKYQIETLDAMLIVEHLYLQDQFLILYIHGGQCAALAVVLVYFFHFFLQTRDALHVYIYNVYLNVMRRSWSPLYYMNRSFT